MSRKLCALVGGLLLCVIAATPADGQDWRPPTREMPAMPMMAELAGDWLSPRAAWFGGIQATAGVSPAQLRPVGEARRGTAQAQVVRFNSGPMPAVAWQDRNGSGRADMIEIYRGGGVIIQVIDADYDGFANVMRTYDSSGALLREERL
jgi:hypothetical protein